jgi:hypothetical protein
MAEYVLIGTSVLVVCIAAFLGFGQNLQALLLGLKSDMAQHAQQAQMTQIEVADTALASQEDDNTMVDLGDLRTSSSNPDALCGQDFCVDAPGLTGTSVSTAGSNGNINITNSAAGIYTQLAKIMAAKGADATTVNLLTNLALKGHTIGDIQSSLSEQRTELRATGNTSEMYKSMKRDANRMALRLREFQQLSTKMNASIDSYPEDVRSLLTGASEVILKVGNSYKFGTTTNSVTGDKLLKFTITAKNVQLTHTNSNTICDNGGDQTKCHRNSY